MSQQRFLWVSLKRVAPWYFLLWAPLALNPPGHGSRLERSVFCYVDTTESQGQRPVMSVHIPGQDLNVDTHCMPGEGNGFLVVIRPH